MDDDQNNPKFPSPKIPSDVLFGCPDRPGRYRSWEFVAAKNGWFGENNYGEIC